MGLNIGFNGSAVPHIKFNARQGSWSFDGQDIKAPEFAIDLANLVTGWLRFQAGLPPSRRIDPDLEHTAPEPDGDHKRGFVVKIHSDELLGGAAEFSSASAHVGTAVSEMHDQFLKERAGHPGKVPVVRCAATVPVKDRHATNHRPVFLITRWIDRPRDLPDAPPVDRREIWTNGGPRKNPQPDNVTKSTPLVRSPLAAAPVFDDDIPF
jgi:hypothetical protein